MNEDLYAQILNDRKTFTDDMEIVVGNQKITLGQLRAGSDKDRQTVADRVAAAEARERTAMANANKAAELIVALEDTQRKLSAQRPTTATAAAAPADDGWSDEWWNPVRRQLAERDKKLEEMVTLLNGIKQGHDAIQKAQETMAAIWAEERWDDQFERLSPRLRKIDKYKDWDRARVVNYALEQKLLDARGLPSLHKAIADLTKQSDIEAARKEGFEEGRKAGQTQNRVANMVRPSSATGGKMPTKGKTAVEEFGLEGLGDDVAQDAELMEQLSQLGDINLGNLQ